MGGGGGGRGGGGSHQRNVLNNSQELTSHMNCNILSPGRLSNSAQVSKFQKNPKKTVDVSIG